MQLEVVTRSVYDAFFEQRPKNSHFLQSSMWGELKRVDGFVPHLIGFSQEGSGAKGLIACCLLLQKKLPLGLSYFYCPSGPLLEEYGSAEFAQVTEKLAEYCREQGGIFLKIDPPYILNTDSQVCKYMPDTEVELAQFTRLGFKHRGFTKNFELSQPRFTFQVDLTPDWADIEKRFDNSTKQRIRKAERYGVTAQVESTDNLALFQRLTDMTESRKGFFSHDKDFYRELLHKFPEQNAKLFTAAINPSECVAQLDGQITGLDKDIAAITGETKKHQNKRKELEKQRDSAVSSREKFAELAKKYPESVTCSSYIITYYGNKAWVLYGANHDDFLFAQGNYFLYQYMMKYAKERGVAVYDLFGTVGDLRKDNPLIGLYDFKSKWGGSYIEFIGEFDLPVRKIYYLLFTKIVPAYRKLKRKIINSRHKKEQ